VADREPARFAGDLERDDDRERPRHVVRPERHRLFGRKDRPDARDARELAMFTMLAMLAISVALAMLAMLAMSLALAGLSAEP